MPKRTMKYSIVLNRVIAVIQINVRPVCSCKLNAAINPIKQHNAIGYMRRFVSNCSYKAIVKPTGIANCDMYHS